MADGSLHVIAILARRVAKQPSRVFDSPRWAGVDATTGSTAIGGRAVEVAIDNEANSKGVTLREIKRKQKQKVNRKACKDHSMCMMI